MTIAAPHSDWSTCPASEQFRTAEEVRALIAEEIRLWHRYYGSPIDGG
jgi:hypothetical protein